MFIGTTLEASIDSQLGGGILVWCRCGHMHPLPDGCLRSYIAYVGIVMLVPTACMIAKRYLNGVSAGVLPTRTMSFHGPRAYGSTCSIPTVDVLRVPTAKLPVCDRGFRTARQKRPELRFSAIELQAETCGEILLPSEKSGGRFCEVFFNGFFRRAWEGFGFTGSVNLQFFRPVWRGSGRELGHFPPLLG